MPYRVRLSGVAKAALRAIAVWLDEVSGTGAGTKLQDRLIVSLQSLASMPKRWPVDPMVRTKHATVRRLVHLEPRHEYLIYFTIDGDEVMVGHIRHGARRRPRKGSL